MAESKRKSRYLKVTSQRSGFDNWDYDGVTFHKRWEPTTDKGLTIAPEELDTPPPSSIPLGGSGISGTPRTNSDTTDLPTISTPVILYITAAGGISINDQPIIYIVGSNSAINISANPQVSAGKSQQIITIQCVGSSVTLDDGTGLDLIAGQQFVMNSGSIINLIYNGTDNLWQETSRIQNGGI